VVNAEFNWWLLIVGLAVGAGLTWLILADLHRGEDDVAAAELGPEAAWIADRLAAAARPLSVEAVEAVLRAHRDYLHLGPDDLDAIAEAGEQGGGRATEPRPTLNRGVEGAGGPAGQGRGGTRPT